jgi:hypothetical protein
VGQTDASADERVDALRQLVLVGADLQRGDRSVAGHPAPLADLPGRVALEVEVGRAGVRPARGAARKEELEPVDEHPGLAELVSRPIPRLD